MIIKTFNRSLTASFFIARVGNVGKPMWKPYTANNSYMVISEQPDIDFQRVKIAYESGAFKPYTFGTCQPFIRLRDVVKVVACCGDINERHLKQVALLESYLEQEQKKLDKQRILLKEMQKAIFSNR
ncbi:hypothetical protein PDPUS_3_00027 (plasmid) [Photobacterium damselae subsp. piscicida]|uniref:Uncharacterized protein n=2 Tax=Photobacterium damsela subsp. piscicida TaxID=38294 RepID=A0AAD1CLF8_PHODP|nr:hypothetical protein [Photobacterium damselae]MDP2513828.1 hypothetical protein [Photobacterium damselae subsp. piscicida]MDP2534193.1 hypothetical protein [Photobacterium damselae subsp. piscicida]MDP2543422.1 hypothetical protein [Photobacterium damselae subsp. piscicida]MDP2556825.1 hypothetical protein [Photobacterium damselae subsp. piscicida]MDP2570385.1 hypothetical protein [Photobacterium damselae subsp. piscicida]